MTPLRVPRIIQPLVSADYSGSCNLALTDLDLPLLRRTLSDRVVGCHVLHYDTLGSTMDESRRLAEQGQPEGTVVIVEEQTSGRGRFSRQWVSPRGENLSFSVLLRPTAPQLPHMNMAATLAVQRAVADVTGLTPVIKWPNDVRVNDRKVSGILIETVMDGGDVAYAIVGIGVNVNFDPTQYPEISSTATSILRETGHKADRTTVLTQVLEHFDDLYGAVRGGGSLAQQWAEQLETLGRSVQVRWQEQVVEGRAEAIDEQGNLMLVRPDGTTFTAVAGEVTLQT